MAAWDAQAAAWARFEHVNERGFALLNDRMVARAAVPPGSDVLEVACGLGSLSQRFRKEGALVVATDFSPAMVERAAEKGLEAHVLDADSALLHGQWDAVVSRMGAFFFPDVPGWLKECHRSLRPDGRVVLGLWGHPNEVPLIAVTEEVGREMLDLPSPPPHGVYRPGGPDPWPDMLREAGFEEVTTEDVVVATPFGTGENAARFLQALAGDISALGSPEEIAAYWAEVARRLPMRDGCVESRAVVVAGQRAA